MAKHRYTLDNTGAPDPQSLLEWSRIVQRAKWPVSFTKPDNSTLYAEMQQITLGSIILYIYETNPVIAKRKINPKTEKLDKSFSLHYINKGSIRCTHNGHETILQEGDVVLSYNAIDSIIEILERTQTLSLKIPEKLLEKHLTNPRQYCNYSIQRNSSYNKILKEIFFSLWRQGKSEVYNDSLKSLIDTFFSVLPSIFERNEDKVVCCKSESLLINISNFIEKNIANIALSQQLIANEFKISPRYLRKIFQEKGIDCLSSHIRFLRLEKCANELIEIKTTEKNVTDIAYKWGFNSSSSFSRAFKEYFGVSPKQYRIQSYRD